MTDSDPSPFEQLDSVERIACIANEHRLAILGELVPAPRTGSQVAKSLGLSGPLVHYHLERLLKHGFVREVTVEAERKGRRSERFFRAKARQLFVDPSLACREDETARALVDSFHQILTSWQRSKILGVDLSLLARRIVVDALDIQEGDRVLLVSQPQVRDIIDHLFIEIELCGGLPQLRPWSREYALARLKRIDPDRPELTSFGSATELDQLAAVILVSTTQPAGPPPDETQRERLPHLLRAMGEWMRAIRKHGVRYVELSVPALGDLEHGEVSSEEAMVVFWRALQSSPKDLSAPVEALIQAVATGADAKSPGVELTLTDLEGTSLRVRVDEKQPHRNIGRVHPADVDAGHLVEEFPPGSVAWFPIEGSGDGSLRLPYVIAGPTRYRDVLLTLKKGLITKVEGAGCEDLWERIEQASGDPKSLAEVRLGVNSVGDRLTGKASLDGVLRGSVTLAFGSNEVLGGTRRATLDLRFPSRTLEVSVKNRVLVAAGDLLPKVRSDT